MRKAKIKILFFLKKIIESKDSILWGWGVSQDTKSSKKKLLELKGLHKGKRCFVVGNGPSLNNMDLNLMKDDFVFTSNSFFLMFSELSFRPQFLSVEDKLVAEDNKETLESLGGILKFYPYDLRRTLKKDSEAVYVNFKRSFIEPDAPNFPLFNSDCENFAYWGGTVLYFNLQLAAHMGFSEVFLIGVDLSYNIPSDVLRKGNVLTSQSDDQNHFNTSYFGKGKRWHLPEVDRMQVAFDHSYRALTNLGIKLFNATEGGNLKNIPRIEFKSLFEKK